MDPDSVMRNRPMKPTSQDHETKTDLELIRTARRGVHGENGDRPAMRGIAQPREVPGYDLICELQCGGQGSVCQAVQQSTGRDVAIKFLRHGAISTPHEQARLQREVQILGQLRHPAIITILDSGRVDGLDYFVMDYVDGQPLDSYVSEADLTVREQVELFAGISDAVQAAHLRGVIHRDLKPANILIDHDGRPHVLDFGLAKLDDASSERTAVTQTGQFLGSLPWSAPEQARGDHDAIDVRTDVYALGVVFWHVLTGRFPYEVSRDIQRTLDNIANVEPSSSHDSRSLLRGDLETILRKCLAKDPARRYQNAGELAEDLQNYLHDRPIAARRDSRWYVLRKTIAHYRGASALAASLFITAVGASIALGILYTQAETSRALAETRAYYANVGAASAALRLGDVATGLRRLEAADRGLRGWEWRYLSGVADESILTLDEPREVPSGVAWSPDGSRLVSGSFDRRVRIWDPKRGALLRVLVGHTDIIFDVAISPDGSIIASGGRDRTVRLWDADSGELLHVLRAPERVTDVDFSPDGARVVAAASYCALTVVWDVATGEQVLRLPSHPPFVNRAAFSPDGKLIATGSYEYGGGQGQVSVRLCDARTGEITTEIPVGGPKVAAIDFSPDGRRLAAATYDDSIKVWRLDDPDAAPVRLGEIGRQATDLRFSHDGSKIFSVGVDGLVRVSDSRTGERLDSFRGHRSGVGRLSVSPDDQFAATSSNDETIKIWNLSEHRGRRVLSGHSHGVNKIVFSPDGKRLVSGSGDSTIRVWDTASWKCLRVLRVHNGPVFGLAFSPDGAVMASGNLDPDSGGLDGAIYLWDRAWNPRLLAGELPSVKALAFRPDGKQLGAALEGAARAWDVATERPIVLPNLSPGSRPVAYSRDSSMLAAFMQPDHVAIYDADSYLLRVTLAVPDADRDRFLVGIAFSPDDALLAVGAKTGVVTVWSTDTWRQRYHVGRYGDYPVSSTAFSPDGTRLAIGHNGGVTIADASNGAPLLTFSEVTDVYAVAFSPDGNHLAACSSDGTIRVWTAPTVKQLP